MKPVMTSYKDVLGQRTVDALIRHNFSAYYCPERKDAIKLIIMQLIPDGVTIGISGSSTLKNLGIMDLLEKCRHEIISFDIEDMAGEELKEKWERRLTCDVFLTDANAISVTGEIIHKDVVGEQVSTILFGPRKIVIVVEIDKIVRNFDEGDTRLEMDFEAMENMQYKVSRFCTKPTVFGGYNNNHFYSISSILHRCPPLANIHVVILGDMLA